MITSDRGCSVRIIAAGGLDPSSGAGLAVDIGVAAKLGAVAFPVAAAVTAQNSLKGLSCHPVEPHILLEQLVAVFDDMKPDYIKVGMVGSDDNARVLARFITDNRLALVLDPVMVSSSGLDLADSHAVAAIKTELIPQAYLVTPNSAEAAVLTAKPVDTPIQAEQAAVALYAMGAKNVVVTGGHLNGAGRVVDTLYNGDRIRVFERERIDGTARGTGCAFATAAAVSLARGLELEDAVRIAGELAGEMIAGAQKVGGGRPQFIFR